MPAYDLGRNRLAASSDNSAKTKAHPIVRMGLFRSWGGSYVDARPALRELAGVATLSIRLNGTRLKTTGGAPVMMSFGMPWSGRLTVSNFVYPSGFTPRVIIVM